MLVTDKNEVTFFSMAHKCKVLALTFDMHSNGAQDNTKIKIKANQYIFLEV